MATTSTSNDAQELTVRKDEYVAFDALSLRSFIRGRLNESGLLTDQNFEGSNLTAITNIIAYSFHTLMFYLNQTSTETMFTEAQLYENMNRIVKVLNYSPIGNQTSTLTFLASASEALAPGTYTFEIESGEGTRVALVIDGVQCTGVVGDAGCRMRIRRPQGLASPLRRRRLAPCHARR